MKNPVIALSLSIMIAILVGCTITEKEIKENNNNNNNTVISTQSQNNLSQTPSDSETLVQTEAEVIATDGLMFANVYGVPADIGIKRFMFEHHSDFF